jgi:hypothetical protein
MILTSGRRQRRLVTPGARESPRLCDAFSATTNLHSAIDPRSNGRNISPIDFLFSFERKKLTFAHRADSLDNQEKS